MTPAHENTGLSSAPNASSTMSSVQPTPPASKGKSPAPRKGKPKKDHLIYIHPMPIRTFPLPTFYPTNPISWIQLAYVWLGQVFLPPPKEPSVVYEGTWDPQTHSVHVRDPRAIRGLWEAGFYGKGTLSRSEPNWRQRELNRRGAADRVIEQVTMSRRDERREMKWERARLELEAIEQTKLMEDGMARGVVNEHVVSLKPPVGPLELLALPNSLAELKVPLSPLPNGNPLATLINGNGVDQQHEALVNGAQMNSHAEEAKLTVVENGHATVPSKAEKDAENEAKPLKRQKSVRFSPQVESTTFQLHDPPSPHESLRGSPVRASDEGVNGSANLEAANSPKPRNTAVESLDDVPDKEWLQISPEETFFLTFGLGVLKVVDPTSRRQISTSDLLTLLRSHSYFPPRSSAELVSHPLRPDDPFLVQYAVYHHFRSLGWVVRHGIKFGADWLLYQRGPVFDHAEFAVNTMPAYSHPEWQNYDHKDQTVPWSMLMGTVRVLSQVYKSLVLVYVDIPPPPVFERAMSEGGIAAALAHYKVREFSVRRWSSNRNR